MTSMPLPIPVSSAEASTATDAWVDGLASSSLDHALDLLPLPDDALQLGAVSSTDASGLSPSLANLVSPPTEESSVYSRSYPLLEEQFDQLPRSYSTTSDIRGTLDHSRQTTQDSGDWGNAVELLSSTSSTGSRRRESEPVIYSRSYEAAPYQPQHRSSLPSTSLERSDSLPVRRLRRSVYAPSFGSYASSAAPSMTDGSASPATTRGSFAAESPYPFHPSPLIDLAESEDLHFPNTATPYALKAEEDAYPFPDMHQVDYPRSAGRHSYSGSPSTVQHQHELNVYRKRPSPATVPQEFPPPEAQLQTAFGNFSFRSSVGPSRSYAYAPPPPSTAAQQHYSIPAPDRNTARDMPQYHPGASPRTGVYDLDGGRRVLVSGGPQHDLLPPHDGYSAVKKRRMSSAGQDAHPSSLGLRREAASSLHLNGLPPPPLSGIPFDGVQEQPHYQQRTRHSYDANSVGGIYSHSPRQPQTPSSASALSRSYGYASFASPSYMDRLAPLPSLDSPIASPRKDGRPYSGSPARQPSSHGYDFSAGHSHSHSHPCSHSHQQPHSHGGASFRPSSAHSLDYVQHLPILPPGLSTYPSTPNQLPVPPPSAGSSRPQTTSSFNDPSYPSTATSPFAVCHRDPPQEDFDNPPPGGMPYEQKLRFEEDQYTPKWVRFEKTNKEGWCALCPGGGKWLQLKNSAFWYHRQFIHGVSSSSGHYFLPPLELRQEGDNGRVLGLCHSCAEWHPYQSSSKGGSSSSAKPPSQWFHHAHKCHTYFSPRKEARKNAKLGL
ncbi:hypothetical protein JCM8097_005241 [Rhodosporidiobolus ruineniae]